MPLLLFFAPSVFPLLYFFSNSTASARPFVRFCILGDADHPHSRLRVSGDSGFKLVWGFRVSGFQGFGFRGFGLKCFKGSGFWGFGLKWFRGLGFRV
jgi:hypothetical protein